MKAINEMTEKEISLLRADMNKPRTNQSRNSFWEKKYHNENILNPDKKKSYLEDDGFLRYWNIR